MKNNIEVEIRARVDNLDNLKETFKKDGVAVKDILHIKDLYFCRKDIFSLAETEQIEVGSYALRLRSTEKNGKTISTINTKIITEKNDHNKWIEYETEVNNYDEMKLILESTEFKNFFSLEKTRSVYKIDDMTVCLEDIVDFGGAIEVEIMTNEENAEKSKIKIKEFLKKYGISENMVAPKSITNIIMHERAKF